MRVPDDLQRLCVAIAADGGRALLIGGAIRDRLLGIVPADYDVEVYGLPADRVVALVRDLGTPHDVGKAFGVLELRTPNGVIHVSLPRRESKVAPGHRGFAVDTDPRLSPEEAARRRDFTINAIAEDPLSGEIIDPFRGRDDLANKILRVVDPATFVDDPLRVLRGAAFAAQFELAVEPGTEAVIRRMVPTLRELPRERAGEEWRKLLLRPRAPSRGLQLLMDWGVFEILHPSFVHLPQTPQNPRWHPEGDVWTHTKLAVDAAARVVRKEGTGNKEQRLATDDRWHILLAVLCHDLGKGVTTVQKQDVWRSRGHDAAGVSLTRQFLQSIAESRQTERVVLPLVREHLQPLLFFTALARGAPVRDASIRALARRLHPATILLLSLVADADHHGRGPFPGQAAPPAAEAGERLRQRAAALGVLTARPEPVLHGADLLEFGLLPGPEFGQILAAAEKLREEHGLVREEVLARLSGSATTADALARLRSPPG